MAEAAPGLETMQLELGHGLRDAALAPPPGLDARATALYRRLLLGNVARTLGKAFPVIRALDGEDAWQRRVQCFFAEHPLQRRELRRLPEDFIEWLEARAASGADAAFLPELAIYEWAELALADDPAVSRDDGAAFTPDAMLQLSPLAWPLSFAYPVHRIRPGWVPAAAPAEPTHLLLHRDADDAVGFLQLGADGGWLLRRLQALDVASSRALLGEWLAASGASLDRRVAAEQRGLELLQDLHQRGIVRVAATPPA